MLKTEETDIDGRKYRSTQLPARRGFALLAKLAKLLGPALAASGGVSSQANITALLPALGEALGELSDIQAEKLLIQILCCTNVQMEGATGPYLLQLDSGPKLDQAFDGEIGSMFKALAFSLKTNYGDFLSGALKTGDQPAQKAEPTQESK